MHFSFVDRRNERTLRSRAIRRHRGRCRSIFLTVALHRSRSGPPQLVSYSDERARKRTDTIAVPATRRAYAPATTVYGTQDRLDRNVGKAFDRQTYTSRSAEALGSMFPVFSGKGRCVEEKIGISTTGS